jgi:hypothetical protein
MQKNIFTRIMTLRTKLLIIINTNKISAKKEKFFQQNLEFLLKLFAFKPIKIEGHFILYLH